jgi:hypothetical protein
MWWSTSRPQHRPGDPGWLTLILRVLAAIRSTSIRHDRLWRRPACCGILQRHWCTTRVRPREEYPTNRTMSTIYLRVTKLTRVCRACKVPTPNTRVVVCDERLGYRETPWFLTPLCPSLSRRWQPDLAAGGRGLYCHDLLVSRADVEGRAESCMFHRSGEKVGHRCDPSLRTVCPMQGRER